MTAPTIVWFRQDLRLADNPALGAAVARGAPIVPVFILDDETPGAWKMGGASRWWLHHSLSRIAVSLERLDARLVLRSGRAAQALPDLIKVTGANAVFWNRCYEPWAVKRDTAIKANLVEAGIDVQSFNSALLAEPWEIETKDGSPFRVFTPFWQAQTKRLNVSAPIPAPNSLAAYDGHLDSEPLESWSLLPNAPDWAGGLRETWSPGEAGAHDRLNAFLEGSLDHYARGRDRPAQENTSRLSPHLHWGEISPRQIWVALDYAATSGKNLDKFRSELGWREFSYHLLYNSPQLPDRNLREEFDAFPWARDRATLRLWQRGQTGFPIVDAGMRELWSTGWMHNRVRMIAASLLVKHLLQPWQDGARWFWDTLVDADLANNSASWQWVAGCGTDAAPFFRIFNPVLQGEKFDSEGTYIRRWVPELSDIPAELIHKPWQLPSPPANYPSPIVDLAAGRRRALDAYDRIKDLKDAANHNSQAIEK